MARKPYFDENGNFYIRPYRMKDLAVIYGVCGRTVRNWMKAKGITVQKNCKYFSIEQVTAIVSALGVPYTICP